MPLIDADGMPNIGELEKHLRRLLFVGSAAVVLGAPAAAAGAVHPRPITEYGKGHPAVMRPHPITEYSITEYRPEIY